MSFSERCPIRNGALCNIRNRGAIGQGVNAPKRATAIEIAGPAFGLSPCPRSQQQLYASRSIVGLHVMCLEWSHGNSMEHRQLNRHRVSEFWVAKWSPVAWHSSWSQVGWQT